MFHFHTDNIYEYTRNVFVAQHDHVVFSARACADVFIALSHVPGDVNDRTYEIALGITANQESVIRGGVTQVNEVKVSTPNILDCNSHRSVVALLTLHYMLFMDKPCVDM